MVPILFYAGFVLAASLFGFGCEVTIEKPQKEGSSADDVPEDIPEKDGGVDGGPGVEDAGENAGSTDAALLDAGIDGGIDAGDVDGGDAGDLSDGGDGGPFVREGIEEHWTTLSQCQIKSLDIFDQKLYVLCAGKFPRLASSPLSQSIAPVESEDVVFFDQSPFDEETPDGGTPLELNPQIHTDIDNGFSVVTFDVTPGERGVFYIIDRANKAVTERVALDHWHIISGGGEIDITFPNPQGALLFSGELLIPFANGVVFEFPWNENGTINWDVPILYFQNATDKNPSLFLKKDDANAWLVNRGSADENSPASIDKIQLHDFSNPPEEEELRADIRPADNLFLGNLELSPLPSLATNPDKSRMLLASGTLLVSVNLEASENNITSLDLEGAANIISIQWYHRDQQNTAFVSDVSGTVFAVRLEEGIPSIVENSVPLQVGLGASALDLSGCIFYQAYRIDSENSAIAAISCDIFEPLE